MGGSYSDGRLAFYMLRGNKKTAERLERSLTQEIPPEGSRHERRPSRRSRRRRARGTRPRRPPALRRTKAPAVQAGKREAIARGQGARAFAPARTPPRPSCRPATGFRACTTGKGRTRGGVTGRIRTTQRKHPRERRSIGACPPRTNSESSVFLERAHRTHRLRLVEILRGSSPASHRLLGLWLHTISFPKTPFTGSKDKKKISLHCIGLR